LKNNNITSSRREFLSSAILGLTSAGVLDLSDKIGLNKEKQKNIFEPKKKTIYRKLGKTDIKIPIVSMGVMNAFVVELVQKSYESGIRLFDTAANYGNGKSEEALGEAIKQLGVRNKVIIATKGLYGNLRRGLDSKQLKERFLDIFNGSLKRLQMKYVDILYLHDCTKAEDVNNQGILEAFTLLKKQKKIRYAGVTSHQGTPQVLDEVCKLGFHDVVEIAFNFTLADYKDLHEAIKKTYEKGIGIVAMKTQGGGQWWREIRPNEWDIKDINQTAALKWVLNNKYITTAIPGFTNYDQLSENFSVASDLEYTDKEKEFLSNRKIDLGMTFCRQCSYCVNTCPYGVDIPSLMRTHMYAAQYNNFYQARDTFMGIPRDQSLIICNNCQTCNAKCKTSMDIAGRIEELKLIYG
jgi:uncharacterized protein